MLATLNHDEFDEGPTTEVAVLPHNIVYGHDGFSDELSGEALDILWSIGAIELRATHSGPGWHTNVYVSRVGVVPAAKV